MSDLVNFQELFMQFREKSKLRDRLKIKKVMISPETKIINQAFFDSQGILEILSPDRCDENALKEKGGGVVLYNKDASFVAVQFCRPEDKHRPTKRPAEDSMSVNSGGSSPGSIESGQHF